MSLNQKLAQNGLNVGSASLRLVPKGPVTITIATAPKIDSSFIKCRSICKDAEAEQKGVKDNFTQPNNLREFSLYEFLNKPALLFDIGASNNGYVMSIATPTFVFQKFDYLKNVSLR